MSTNRNEITPKTLFDVKQIIEWIEQGPVDYQHTTWSKDSWKSINDHSLGFTIISLYGYTFRKVKKKLKFNVYVAKRSDDANTFATSSALVEGSRYDLQYSSEENKNVWELLTTFEREVE